MIKGDDFFWGTAKRWPNTQFSNIYSNWSGARFLKHEHVAFGTSRTLARYSRLDRVIEYEHVLGSSLQPCSTVFGWVATNQLLVQSDRLITLLGGGCNQPIWKLLVKLDHSPGRHEITTYLPSNDIDSLRCRIAKEQWKLSSPGRNLTDLDI